MEQLSFAVAEVQGPLDLILQLIAKHKLNIWDIDITALLAQYMEQMERMQSMDMEISSEFLEMASRLVYIKSVSLLPKHTELEQLKRELTGQLIEYGICKQIAGTLSRMYCGGKVFVTPPSPLPLALPYSIRHNTSELVEAYMAVADKSLRRIPPPAESFEPLVSRRVVSVGSKLTLILTRLYRGKELRFHSLLDKDSERSDIVATFLAVLELIKSKRVTVEQSEDEWEEIDIIKV